MPDALTGMCSFATSETNTMATILLPGDFTTMPWKNGGGVTHEIARDERNGAMLWRLSIAEVASDGAFSLFPGMTRLLTVITGNGMTLEADDAILTAKPRQPVRFSGDAAIEGRLTKGPVRDLNFIFDASNLNAAMSRRDGPTNVNLHATAVAAAICIEGLVQVDGARLPVGAAALGCRQQLVLSAASCVIVIIADAVLPMTV